MASEEIENAWTFALDADGDILLTDMKQPAIVSGRRAVLQALKVAIATAKEEDPLDAEFGLDVFEATNSVPLLDRELRRTIKYDDKAHDRVETIHDVDIRLFGDRHAEVRVELEFEGEDIQVLTFNVGGLL